MPSSTQEHLDNVETDINAGKKFESTVNVREAATMAASYDYKWADGQAPHP